MKINIENTPRSISDLFFNDGNTIGAGEFTCIGKNQRVNKIIIPIYQREYDWEKEELLTLLINTTEYLSNLKSANYRNSYFIGTVLLELQKGNKGYFELIDGQQRLTTSFLINYIGYLIAVERFNKIPSLSPKRLATEFSQRLHNIKMYEDKLFVNKKTRTKLTAWNFIFSSAFLDIEGDESSKKISSRLNIDNILEQREPKIEHKNPSQKELFIDAIKNTKLENKNNQYSLTELSYNQFNERANNIFDYFTESVKDLNLDSDQKLGRILECINNFSTAISFCVLVSDNPDDSFKLFEVLNSTGRRLTIIDQLKNHLYENIVNKNQFITNEQFNTRWREILDLIPNTVGVNITLDLVRSEGALIKEKFYKYFTNKTIYLSKKTIKRDNLFIQESPLDFLNRITIVAKTLNSIYSIDSYDKLNMPHTLGWYYRIMNKLGYDWGRQVFLGSIILTSHLKKKFPIDQYWNTPLIDNLTTLKTQDTTTKFVVNLSDILLKIGIIGIINGLSTKRLPTISQDILSKIISFVRDNKQEPDLPKLFEEIKGQLQLLIDDQKQNFDTNLRCLTYTKSSDKKIMTLLLYILYNKGSASVSIFHKPTLEHFEPRTQQIGNTKYYSGPDREELIHTLGNMILMNQDLNSKLGNLAIPDKLEKISKDFSTNSFFGTPLYRNLNPTTKTKGNISPYINFPVIDKKIAYKANGTPNKELFKLRLNFYITNLLEMICTNNKYILSGEEYDI